MEYQIRPTVMSDARILEQWFQDKEIEPYFPMCSRLEYLDAAIRWVSFCRYGASLTAEVNRQPIGIATLYLQPYKRLMHSCELGIIVDKHYRGEGIGQALLEKLFILAKDSFQLEVLHLQVNSNNPAIRLYARLGFKEFGRHKKWIKDPVNGYYDKVLMERDL